jgi:hypothetical protein
MISAKAKLRLLAACGFALVGIVSAQSPTSLAQALDAPQLAWQTGDPPWSGQASVTYDGLSAAQSGPVGSNQESWLQYTNVFMSDGVLSFWWRVSSAANQDFLRFSINGIEQASLSGAVDWEERRFLVGAGTNVMRWNFAKKSPGTSSPAEGGWVDQIKVIQYESQLWDLDNNFSADLAEFMFRGGAGDGADGQTFYNLALAGDTMPLAVALGGTGDGFDSHSLYNYALGGDATPLAVVLGGTGDGFDSHSLYNYALGGDAMPLAVVLGGTGDGFDSHSLYNYALGGDAIPLAVVLGGTGDGFDGHSLYNYALGGDAVPLAVVLGGTGDGFDNHTLYNYALGGDAMPLALALGGNGDGFDSQLYYNLALAGDTLPLAMFTGGGGDGFDAHPYPNANMGVLNSFTVMAPRIVVQPLSQTANSSQTVVFSVSVIGTAPLAYQWRKNENPLSGANTTSLFITNLLADDAGNYSVIITNFSGSTTSSNALLTVLVSVPPGIQVNDGSLRFNNGLFGFNLVGTPGDTVIIDISFDLIHWFPLQTNTLPEGPLYFSDPSSGATSTRFYRIRTP